MIDLIQREFAKHQVVGAKELGKITSLLYSSMPLSDDRFIEVCDQLIRRKDMKYFSIATLLIKRRKTILTNKYFSYYDNWVTNNLFGWWSVDQLAIRVISPVIKSDQALHASLLKWSDSDNYLVRRLSLVSMIEPTKRGLTVQYDYSKMIFLVNKLKQDNQYYVKKAVGWVLKCAFLSYPKEIEQYLRRNVSNLDRGIFRYALEHIENPLRKELLAIKR